MTDPQALAVAFLENLETKIINISRKYSGYYFQNLKVSYFISNLFFKTVWKITSSNGVKIPMTDLSVCGSIPQES